LIQEKRDGDIALAAQALHVETFRLLTVCAAVYDVIDDGVKVVVFAIQFVSDARQIVRLQHLKLVAD
jgi:hypothetical protein